MTFDRVEAYLKTDDSPKWSEERFRAYFQNAHDGIALFNSDGLCQYVSPSIESILGFKPEEIIGRNWTFLTHSEDAPAHKIKWSQMTEQPQRMVTGEFRARHREGAWRWLKVIGSNQLAEPGIGAFVFSFHDITERKNLEETLKESEKRYRELVENINDVIYIVDPSGYISYISPVVEGILGFRPDEIVNRHFAELIFPEDREAIRGAFEDLLEGKLYPSEYRIVRKSGDACWVRSSSRPVYEGGRLVAIQGRFTDISRVKQIEEEKSLIQRQLLHAQKLEAIGTLAGGIAHEFNNLLMGIIGYAEMTLEELEGNEELQRYQKLVLKAGARAKDLVTQILAFSRYADQEKKLFNIGFLIKETVKLLRASIPSTIEIRQRITAEKDVILADPTQVQQVIMNLCTNAVQAMETREGLIEVALEKVTLEKSALDVEPGEFLRLTVKDTGHGIHLDIRDRIFEPFFTTRGVRAGTGLGLAVVYGIVKAHGGGIAVESEPGKGTAFSVFFPVAVTETAGEKAEAALSSVFPLNARILFVDDDEIVAAVGRDILTSLGCDVTVRKNGTDALKTFKANPRDFDLVITDYTMPEMTGVVLAVEIMRIRRDMPVILCTGFNERIADGQARAMGIRDFLMKPLRKYEIAEAVRRALGKERR